MGLFASIAPSLVGGLISAGSDYLTNQQSMDYASFASKSAFSRSKWMASNKHQMEVEDLKKAGLNPILSAMGGGSAPNVPIAPVPSLKSPGASAVQSMLEYRQAKSAIELNNKLAYKAVSDAELSESLSEKAKADKVAAERSADFTTAQTLATTQETGFQRFRWTMEQKQIEDAIKYHVYNLPPALRGSAAHSAHVGAEGTERGMNLIQLAAAKVKDMLRRAEIEAQKKENSQKRRIKNREKQDSTVNININAVIDDVKKEHPELFKFK